VIETCRERLTIRSVWTVLLPWFLCYREGVKLEKEHSVLGDIFLYEPSVAGPLPNYLTTNNRMSRQQSGHTIFPIYIWIYIWILALCL
jgi:hypothetical protein